jgi:pimeloyl-ACP methyl ester carboxylesterase
MKIFTTAFLLVFSIPAFSVCSTATELNAIGAADIAGLSAGLSIPAPQPVFVEASTGRNGLDPVVITIPGLRFGEIGWGPLEIRNLLKFIKVFFPDKGISEADIVNGMVSFNPRYFFPEDAEDTAGAAYAASRLDDNYMDKKLEEIPGYAQRDLIIIPFSWSRDPGDSKAVIPELQARIIEVCDTFKDSGRPVYILAHSWGSVLAHTALHRAARSRPDLRVDKFITAGSPLVPPNFVVKLFMKLEIKKEGLEPLVSKPSIVRVWRNFWAMRDAYSDAIPAADSNLQADKEVENVEPGLIALILQNKELKIQARKDLFKIRDIRSWHYSYFFDYKASLRSIGKEIFVPVFQPSLSPQVMDSARSPGI